MTDLSKLTALTSEIVSAYVENNSLSAADLPGFIANVYATLAATAEPESAPAQEPALMLKPTAAQIRKSITPGALISFLDGKPYKVLKRHLNQQGLTVAAYKAQFGLPSDYPTTAPSYSAMRSSMALAAGLGRGARAGDPDQEASSAAEDANAPSVESAPAKRPRKKLHLPFSE